MSDGGTGVDTSGIEKAMTNNWEDSFLKITGIAKAGLKTFAKSIIDVGIELSGLGDEIETILLPVTESIVQAFDELGSKLKEALGSEEMKAHIQNIADGIGKLIEIVAELISEWIPKIIEGLSWIVDNGEEILTIITSVTVAIYAFKAGAIITSVVESWKKAKEAIASYEVASKGAKLSQGIMNGVFSVWEIIVSLMTGKITLAAAATGLWSKAVAALNKAWKNNPMGIVLVAIVAVVGAIVYLWNTNEGFRTAIIDCWNAILNAGKVVWEWLVKFFTEDIPNAWNSMLEWFSSVGEWFASLWITIKQAFVDGWNSIVFFFTESIPAWWESVKLSFVTGWQAITNFFTETIPALIEAIFIWFSELPYKIGYALGYVIATVIKWGIDTWASFSEACINIYNTVIEWFSQLPIKIGEFISTAYNNIVEWGTNIWNKFIEICTNVYNSVTEWFSQLPIRIGEFISAAYNNIVEWGTNIWNKFIEICTNVYNSVTEWFSKLPGVIWEWLVNTYENIVDWGSNITDAVTNLVSSIIDVILSLPGKVWDIGVNIVEGLWGGIISMGSWIADKISGFFSGIVDGAKSALGIKSPSRVFRDQVGKYMAQGVGVGFEDETPSLKRDINKNLDSMLSGLNTELISAKLTEAVYYETSRTSNAMTYGVNKLITNNSSITNNNDNGVTQNVTIVNPERTPSENARELKKVGRDLVFG